MLARPHLRGGQHLSWRVALGCVLALALLASRATLPHFSCISSRHSLRTATFCHFGQKQCLEHSDVPVAAPAASLLPEFVPQLVPHSPASPPLLSFLSDGPHYNRPPPTA